MPPRETGRQPRAPPRAPGPDEPGPVPERSAARRAWAANDDDRAWLDDLLRRGA